MKKIEFNANEMECTSCAKVIIDKLAELEDVADVRIGRDRKNISVEFNTHRTCDSDLTCAVEGLGYRVHAV